MDVRRTALSLTATAIAAAALTGCTSTGRTATTYTPPTQHPTRAPMLAADGIGAAIFASDTAIAGDFRPYAGRVDGPAQAAFITRANESAYAGVRTD